MSTDALGNAEREAAITKKKAREAKASLKKARKLWKAARKAARAARRELAALQEDIASTEKEAASAEKKSRLPRRRAAKKASPTPQANPSKRLLSGTGRLPIPRKRVRAASMESSAVGAPESVSGRGGAEQSQDEAAAGASSTKAASDSAVQIDDSTPAPRPSGS